MDKIDYITVISEIGIIAFLIYISPLLGVMIGGMLVFAHICPDFAYDHEGE